MGVCPPWSSDEPRALTFDAMDRLRFPNVSVYEYEVIGTG